MPDVVERADMRMIQCGNRLAFTFETLAAIRIGRDVRGEHFDRHGAIKARVAGFVDFTMPPAPIAD